jgi:DNA-binding SARP family transcriptional activator
MSRRVGAAHRAPNDPAVADPSFLRLHLLGTPSLGRAGGELHALERKDAALLALLALEGARGRDELAALLWPEAPARAAAGSLRQRIFRLRRKHGHELVHAGDRLQLLPDVHVDLAAGGAAAQADERPLLAGCEYGDCPDLAAWIDLQRARRRSQRQEAMASQATAHESGGELAGALELAQRLVAEEPLSEHAARRVMRLHYLRGDRAAALDAFERCERRLKDELGARPCEETLALLATVEGAEPPAPATPRAPVPASLQRPPRLVGRRRELAALAEARAAGQVFVLLGEAGMGKSRLLAEWVVAGAAAVSAGPPRCLHVMARPGDSGVPYALLARLLRALFERTQPPTVPSTRRELARVLPEWSATRPAGEAHRLVLQQAVEDVLAGSAGDGSRIGSLAELLLDDLHFADAASLELLQGLIAGERLRALQWGLAQRPGEGGPAAQALRDALVETQRLREVVLSPLDAEAMTELVASLGLAGQRDDLDLVQTPVDLVPDPEEPANALRRPAGSSGLSQAPRLGPAWACVGQPAWRDRNPLAVTGTERHPPPTVPAVLSPDAGHGPSKSRSQTMTPRALGISRRVRWNGSDTGPECESDGRAARTDTGHRTCRGGQRAVVDGLGCGACAGGWRPRRGRRWPRTSRAARGHRLHRWHRARTCRRRQGLGQPSGRLCRARGTVQICRPHKVGRVQFQPSPKRVEPREPVRPRRGAGLRADAPADRRRQSLESAAHRQETVGRSRLPVLNPCTSPDVPSRCGRWPRWLRCCPWWLHRARW